nr:hypothetical protein MACL_00002458 [Theileria orientalis]
MSSYFRDNSLASLRCGTNRFVFVTSAFYVHDLKVKGTQSTAITSEVKKECDYGEACTFIPKLLPGLKKSYKDSFFYITFMCFLEKDACLTMDCPPNSNCVIEGPLPPVCVCQDGYTMKKGVCVPYQPIRSVRISERPPWSGWKPGISGQLGPLELRHSGPPQDLHLFISPKDPWEASRRRFTHSDSTTAVYGSRRRNSLSETDDRPQDDTNVHTKTDLDSLPPEEEHSDLDSGAQDHSLQSENESAPTEDKDGGSETDSVSDEDEDEDEDSSSDDQDSSSEDEDDQDDQGSESAGEQDEQVPASENGSSDETGAGGDRQDDQISEAEDSESGEDEDDENEEGSEAEAPEDVPKASEDPASQGDDSQQSPGDETHSTGDPELYHSSGHPGGDPEPDEEPEVHPEDLESDKLEDLNEPETGAVKEHHNDPAHGPETAASSEDAGDDEYEDELKGAQYFSDGAEPVVSQMTHDDTTSHSIATLRTACKFTDGYLAIFSRTFRRVIVFDKLCDYRSCSYRYKVCS